MCNNLCTVLLVVALTGALYPHISSSNSEHVAHGSKHSLLVNPSCTRNSTTVLHKRRFFSAPIFYYHNCCTSYHLERVVNLSNDIEVNSGPDVDVFRPSDSSVSESSLNSSSTSLSNSSHISSVSSNRRCNNILSIFFNARSVVNKLVKLHSIVDTDNPDVLAIDETWINDSIADSEIVDPSYIIFRRDRHRHGGGVLIAVKDYLNPSRAPQYEHKDNRTCLG